MNANPYFVKRSEVRQYSTQGVNIGIEVNEKVFPPPQEISISAEHMCIHKGESVMDIGTGSGMLAIIAAKLGGKVHATDIDAHAIELAKKNAFRNKVDVEFQVGKNFSGNAGVFDVIVANLSQTLLTKKSKEILGSLAVTIDGGVDGNEHLLQLLEEAQGHMHERSRLYVNVFTISDHKVTLQKMLKMYHAELKAVRCERVKECIEKDIEQYKDLSRQGKVCIFEYATPGEWFAEQLFFELSVK